MILTRGSKTIQALAGDDLICVSRGGSVVTVFAGAGDDSIEVLGMVNATRAYLGYGADTYLGGPGPDLVYAGDSFGSQAGPSDNEADSISTGAGHDEVTWHEPSDAFIDRIDLGPGFDIALMSVPPGEAAPGAMLDAGSDAGESLFLSDGAAGGTQEWTLDAATGLARGEVLSLPLRGFSEFYLSGLGAGGVSFVGTPVRDSVFARAVNDVDLGAGDDYLEVRTMGQEVVDGGAGRDVLSVGDARGLTVDLRRGHVQAQGDATRHPIEGFEDVSAVGPTAVLKGDSGPNRLFS